MALIDTDLIVRYYIDEAASGSSPTEVSDDSGVGSAANLTLDYGTALAYTEVSGQRGLESTSVTGDHHAKYDITNADKIDAMNGVATKVTIEIVADITSGSGSSGRIFAINAGSSSATIGILATGTDIDIYWNESLMRYYTRTTGRMVTHIVIDTTLATANDRVKIYENGVLKTSGITIDGNPTQNDTLSISDTSDELWMFNRGASPRDRSIDGILFYAALYDGAFTAQNCSDNYDVLIADDDTPAAGGGVAPTAVLTGPFGGPLGGPF
jgi:hypothetical protein